MRKQWTCWQKLKIGFRMSMTLKFEASVDIIIFLIKVGSKQAQLCMDTPHITTLGKKLCVTLEGKNKALNECLNIMNSVESSRRFSTFLFHHGIVHEIVIK